jgi:hypothetical protein
MSLSLAISSLVACVVNLVILYRFHEETRKLQKELYREFQKELYRELQSLRGVVRVLEGEEPPLRYAQAIIDLESSTRSDGSERQRLSSSWPSFPSVLPTPSGRPGGKPL